MRLLGLGLLGRCVYCTAICIGRDFLPRESMLTCISQFLKRLDASGLIEILMENMCRLFNTRRPCS